MKTAEERSREIVREFDGFSLSDEPDAEQMIELLTRAFKEFGRDQRHMIAELLAANDALPTTTQDAHAIAMNTPFPGEG